VDELLIRQFRQRIFHMVFSFFLYVFFSFPSDVAFTYLVVSSCAPAGDFGV
jgi:hypothetical protein